MHAHLVPIPSGTAAPTPPEAVASCLLTGPQRSWLLALTDGPAPWEVEALDTRPGGGTAWATVVEFDGPRDPAQVEADRRSGSDRIWPAAAQVPGVKGAVVLRAEDGAMVVVSFADTADSLEAARLAILSTPLLPGEDPALLQGPDRSAVVAVHDDGVAALLSAAAAPAVPA